MDKRRSKHRPLRLQRFFTTVFARTNAWKSSFTVMVESRIGRGYRNTSATDGPMLNANIVGSDFWILRSRRDPGLTKKIAKWSNLFEIMGHGNGVWLPKNWKVEWESSAEKGRVDPAPLCIRFHNDRDRLDGTIIWIQRSIKILGPMKKISFYSFCINTSEISGPKLLDTSTADRIIRSKIIGIHPWRRNLN